MKTAAVPLYQVKASKSVNATLSYIKDSFIPPAVVKTHLRAQVSVSALGTSDTRSRKNSEKQRNK